MITDMYWDCNYCDEYVARGDDRGVVKEAGKRHLLSEHFDELEDSFVAGYRGKRCRHCSLQFPRTRSDHPGFECSDCNHDHSSWYAGYKVGLTIRDEPEESESS